METGNFDIKQIADLVLEVANDMEYRKDQYELFIDLMSSFESKDMNNIYDSTGLLQESICQLNRKLQNKYNTECQLFDTADPNECFQPKYTICKKPRFCDYAELYVSILAMEYFLVHNDRANSKYSIHTMKREFISNIGRFLFLHNGYITVDYSDEQTNNNDIFAKIFMHSIQLINSFSWNHEEHHQLRILLLNIFDAVGATNKSEIISLIKDSLVKITTKQTTLSDELMTFIFSTLDKYYEYIAGVNKIVEIKVSWLYAYIYKKRFGFMFCKKFAKNPNTSSLPYKFVAYSNAFKDMAFIQAFNGPKVVLFDAGENRRSSEYVPIQSSAFYNAASGMFE